MVLVQSLGPNLIREWLKENALLVVIILVNVKVVKNKIMAGDIECGNCDVCKKQNVIGIERTYFRYEEIKCECHGNYHFEMVYHCPTCVPTEPVETKLVIQTSRLRELVLKKEYT